jgi:hypothetical protein
MHSLMTEELAEQRRQDLLRRAERARRAEQAERAHSGLRATAARGSSRRGWRAVAGLALVRIGVRLGGDALADSVVVVAGRGTRPALLAVVWRGHDGGLSRHAGTGRSNGRPPAFSRW